MTKASEIFEVKYGVNLELNKLTQQAHGINFVSRTAKNNGVSARVAKIAGLEPLPSGVLTVAGGGSVLETFLQPEPFYSGRDLYYLTPKVSLSDTEKLFYCLCIKANAYKYNYGRQANRTLKDLQIPDPSEIPSWVNSVDLSLFDGAQSSKKVIPHTLSATDEWVPFTLEDLFVLKKGKRLTKANMTRGTTPFIGSTDSNNGVTAYIGQTYIHEGNTLSVAYNGSVAEAFYQPVPFWATDDVNVLYPRFEMSPEVGLFICTILRNEKYRFNYGRKWHLDRMKSHTVKLPVNARGSLDLEMMGNFISSLSYSSQIR